MAGITAFIAGEHATAGEIHWTENNGLSFDLQLIARSGGKETSPRTVSDYGSDIGIDPRIQTGDQVRFLQLDGNAGLWSTAGTELDLSKFESAVEHVKFNRSLFDSKDQYHTTLEAWLQELATQTRTRVVRSDRVIQPASPSTLKRFMQPMLDWLGEGEDHLLDLNAASFERLLLTLFDRMGNEVKLVGDTYKKDGGIDIIAWSKHGLRHLVAIQAKHHGTGKKASVRDVRDFVGALEANPVFGYGFLVTNTEFTKDAEACAKRVSHKVRLCSGQDICRWLKHDTSADEVWLPNEIELAHGVTANLNTEMRITDMNSELRRAYSILETFLPSTNRPREPFGKMFDSSRSVKS